MSLAAQLAWSAAAFVAVALLAALRAPRPWTGWEIGLRLLSATYIAAVVFDQLHFGWLTPASRTYHPIFLLIGSAIGLIALLRVLITRWNDDEALEDEFDEQSYIRRRKTMPVRLRAILTLALLAAMLAISIWLAIHTPVPGAA